MDKNDATANRRCIIQGEPNDFDVLLGRGNHVNYRPGNVRFRKLAEEKSLAYASANTKANKDAIAAELMDEVTKRGGRFLRQVKTLSEDDDDVWEEVTGKPVSTKVKQSMRDALKTPGGSQTLPLASIGKCPEEQGTNKPVHRLSTYSSYVARKRVSTSVHTRTPGETDGVRYASRAAQEHPPIGSEERSNVSPLGIRPQPLDRQNHRFRPGNTLETRSAMLQQLAASDLGEALQQQMIREQHHSIHQFVDSNLGFGVGNPQYQDCSQSQQLQQLLLQSSLQHQLQHMQQVRGQYVIPTSFGQQTSRDPLGITTDQQHAGVHSGQELLPRTQHDALTIGAAAGICHEDQLDVVNFGISQPLALVQNTDSRIGTASPPIPEPSSSLSHSAMLPPADRGDAMVQQPPRGQLQPLPFRVSAPQTPDDICFPPPPPPDGRMP